MSGRGPKIKDGDTEESLLREHRATMVGPVVLWVLSAIIALAGLGLGWLFPNIMEGSKRAGLAWNVVAILAASGPIWLGVYWFFEGVTLKRRIQLVQERDDLRA